MDSRRQVHDAIRAGNPHTSRMISVLSGKGGVGKSIIAFNLAERMAADNQRVLLVDADHRGGNIHILANLACDHGLREFAAGGLSLSEAVSSHSENLDILASLPFESESGLENVEPTARLARELRKQAAGYDLVVLDHGSGVSDAAAVLASASDLNLIVVIPELTSIADAYGLFKYLCRANASIDCRLLLNRISSIDETEFVQAGFAAVSEQFLGRTAPFVASLAEDASVRKSVASQQPIACVDSESPVVQVLTELGRILAGVEITPAPAEPTMQINQLTAPAEIRE